MPQSATSPSGAAYISRVQNLNLAVGSRIAMLDKYAFELARPAEATPAGDDVLVAASDLEKIYAPGFAVPAEFVREDGLVPALATMRSLGKHTSRYDTTNWEPAGGIGNVDGYREVPFTMLAISESPEGSLEGRDYRLHSPFQKQVVKPFKLMVRGAKRYGTVRRAFYSETAGKCITCELYIPTCVHFEPERRIPCLLVFPGGNGEASSFDSTIHGNNLAQTLQHFAEERGIMLVTCESFVRGSQYGDITAPYGREPVPHPEDSANPFGYSPERLHDIAVSEAIALETLDFARALCPQADPARISCFGFSMGTLGVFSMALRHGERFRSYVAVGGAPTLPLVDLSPMRDARMLFIAGTEDVNGFDFLLAAIERLRAELPGFECRISGGAMHGHEWKPYARDIFDFIER